MNSEPSEQLNVNPKDLECGVCYSRYSLKTNEPLIMTPCGHSICSSCFKKIKDVCPFCKAEISQSPIRNLLLSSLLERDSQVKKCETHKQPIDYYSKESHKLVCSQCALKENPDKFGSIQEVHARMEERKKAIKSIQEKKEEGLKTLHEKISQGNKSLKRKLDDLCEERLAKHLAKQKKLKSSLNVIMFTEKEQCEHQYSMQELSKYEENYKMLENWRNSQEENIVAKVFDTTLTTKQAFQFYSDKAQQLSKSSRKKEKNLLGMLVDTKNNFGENFFNKLSEVFHSNTKVNPKHHQEIVREYLLDTFEDHGIVANYQEKEDCFELSKSSHISKLKKFYPDFFECSIEKLNFSCSSISDVKFKILCELLQATQSLSNLTVSLKEPCSRKIELLSNLILSSETIRNFSLSMPLRTETDDTIQGEIQSLLNSQRVSGFHIRFPLEDIFQQDLVLFPAQTKGPIEEFRAKFIGCSDFSNQILAILSGALSNTTALRIFKLHFGDQIFYDIFLQKLYPLLNHSHNLQELDLGFANVDELQSHGRGQEISEVIINSKELKKVNLFLAGDDLSEDVFDDLFYLKEPKVFAGHKLEEFSLTIMRCGDLNLDEFINFLKNFALLKKLILRINRTDINFQKITRFLDNIPQLKSLIALDLACRDFERLTEKNKKDLKVCQYRLNQYRIQNKVVFQRLEPDHLPDYVDFLSDDEDEEDDENEGNEGNEGNGDEENEDEDYEVEEEEEEDDEDYEGEEEEGDESEDEEIAGRGRRGVVIRAQ